MKDRQEKNERPGHPPLSWRRESVPHRDMVLFLHSPGRIETAPEGAASGWFWVAKFLELELQHKLHDAAIHNCACEVAVRADLLKGREMQIFVEF